MILLGFVVITCIPYSLVCAYKRKYAPGLLLALLALASAGPAAYDWMDMLENSGKPVFLFGIKAYPPLGLFCIAMFLVSAACIAVNIYGIAKREKAR